MQVKIKISLLITSFIISVITVIILFSGCGKRSISKSDINENKEIVIKKCIKLCNNLKNKIDMGSGPCLSELNISWGVDDWVCDVAHWPRQNIDNLARNQCQNFRQGKSKHFVEVDEECNFIRAI